MEITKIIQDQKQTRTTIPKKYVEEANIKTGDRMRWDLKKGVLSAKVMSHAEFLEEIKKATSLRAQTKKHFVNCEVKE